jgi:hypothetical protein
MHEIPGGYCGTKKNLSELLNFPLPVIIPLLLHTDSAGQAAHYHIVSFQVSDFISDPVLG